MPNQDLIPIGRQLSVTAQAVVPALIETAGAKTKKRFIEYFVAEIRNPRTRTRRHPCVVRSDRGNKKDAGDVG